ncbi:hypothetical protein ECHHL_0424 [Ehrlichia chaffeensis str. Heartland]|uniref:Uncharacterized protein n=1 Tax=Ehrlichia chaffeensis (strain ATCC CRL-10679 / Arkansas) TaxID=205920 RepID=Q2GGX8_EHRCR|nr:hypothetical protein [Ehrlichia chaffeensis]ABD44811.1 hypothetical protein ECH_0489 [Ehrlichia chaffeensis str. Arkansas]AHX03586.1 hypothetical protein ECHHL_0424 [Ehrlichia chaffeensis str. Heartland]AHX05692.1 hypothetical protein ECHJAX_0632 [Ehrlichia chaffeensis str. Jax]AHX06684.1 hypothetical protein ECHLIB_0636 [Ehrlichia chaffeensis str. Liberty]AHX07967.1 hypothetical protein ECHOSC_0432 [Ehrlichia chaffeensis str. Osceola]
MVDDKSYKTKSSSLNGLSEDANEKVSDVLHDVKTLAFSNINEDDDFRFLGKVKLEDLEVQESILELDGAFNKFLIEHSGEYSGVIQSHEYDYDASAGEVQNLDLDNFEIEESFLQKILDFFSELCEQNEDYIDFDYELDPLKRKRKKKKFILESIIEFLKRFLRSGRSLNLKELLDEQISELQEELVNELDPERRKLLQERLMLLTELRAQMIQYGIGSNLLFRFFLFASFVSSLIGLQQDTSSAKQYVKLAEVLGLSLHKGNEKVLDANSNSIVASQTLVVTPPLSFFVYGYTLDVFRGKINDVSYKLQDQYFFVRDASLQLGPQYGVQGIFFAVATIMNAIDQALRKVANAVKKAVDKLDIFEHSNKSSGLHDFDRVGQQSHSTIDYACTARMNFVQSTATDFQCTTGLLSSLNYHRELKFSCSGVYNNSYLDNISVVQCSIQSNTMIYRGH